MKKSIFGQSYIYEGCFKAWIEVFDAAFEDASDESVLIRTTLSIEFLEDSIYQQCDSFFERFSVDDQLTKGLFFLSKRVDDFGDEWAFLRSIFCLFAEPMCINRFDRPFFGRGL